MFFKLIKMLPFLFLFALSVLCFFVHVKYFLQEKFKIAPITSLTLLLKCVPVLAHSIGFQNFCDSHWFSVLCNSNSVTFWNKGKVQNTVRIQTKTLVITVAIQSLFWLCLGWCKWGWQSVSKRMEDSFWIKNPTFFVNREHEKAVKRMLDRKLDGCCIHTFVLVFGVFGIQISGSLV